MLNTSRMHNKFNGFLISVFLVTASVNSHSENARANVVKLDENYSIAFEYRNNIGENVFLARDGRNVGSLFFRIPKGRDPARLGMDSYNRAIFSHPIKTLSGYAIPYLFTLRTNSGDTKGQCGTGIEAWLKIIVVDKDSIAVKKNELVQSCQYDMYLQDKGDGRIENAFQEKNGAIVVKWLSHPKNNGDDYSEAIPLN
ncbi:hypothetical protein [Chromobacterium sp. IIBBL 290-4]|uniref:hypothetical protein n=1 Tax=Chromobacterium sp. IIBBL 290-4 TaxID=2953890 RepID=UPI0020B7AB67|nr:hypothetical protein [Chromobacterium sp. IIBBL 290-4]UTH73759.1 hypothetical protein NKT35_19780 [Chromobacterium sp. IIBBL 290-4]